jgi:hypothetical protein
LGVFGLGSFLVGLALLPQGKLASMVVQHAEVRQGRRGVRVLHPELGEQQFEETLNELGSKIICEGFAEASLIHQ